MTPTSVIEQRFASKVDRSAGPDACWPFTGATQGSYGAFWNGERQIGAHRYALGLQLGRAIPADIEACHRCDNTLCCNPAHLFEGTRAENAADMAAKGRASRLAHPSPGARNGRAKLTAADVAYIRSSTEPNTRLAPLFGVCDAQISRIRRGIQWTTEAESGVTTASRSSSDLVPPGPDRGSPEAPTGHADASSSSGPVIAPASAEGGPFATHGATSPGHNPGPVSRPAPDLAGRQSSTSRDRGRSSDRADQLTTFAPA